MNIALIVPEFLSGSSFLQPPLDLLYCAARLKKSGFGVVTIDCRAKSIPYTILNKMLEQIDIVIITTSPYDQVQNYFVDYRFQNAVRTINYIKSLNEQRFVIVCGSHGTVRPDIILRDTYADIVVRGEYERTLEKLVEAIANKSNFGSIPNIVYRTINGSVRTMEDVNTYHISDFGSIFPDYDQIDFSEYYGDKYINNQPVKQKNWGVIQASRGCPYNCTFCYNFWGRKVRKRNPDSIVEELEILEKKYGVNHVFFIDFTFTLDYDWVSNICKRIRKKDLGIKWTVETRCDLLNNEILFDMKSANCEQIWLGVESFSNEIVRSTRKYTCADLSIQAIKSVINSGIDPSVFIMLGLPGESVTTINQTIMHLHNLKVPYTKSIIISTPRFGTDYYTLAKKQFPFLGETFQDLDAVKGLVANDMAPHYLIETVSLMKNRKFVFNETCPQINSNQR